MQENINKVALAMKKYYDNNPEKMQHFARVYTLAKTIGELEKIPKESLELLELSSIVHEIDKNEEIESIKLLLIDCGIDDSTAKKVCHIVENKSDYEHIGGLEHQILIEADFIVHIKEENLEKDKIVEIGNKYFFTNYGRAFLKKAYNI